jgi:putative membrane protein
METSSTPSPDRGFLVFNTLVSGAAVAFLAWLLLVHGGAGTPGVDLRFMPAVNACLNATSAFLLVAAYVAIRSGRRDLHRRLTVSAYATSALFLAGYVAYHYVHGDTRYEGPYRGLYLGILGSHVLLSIGVVPMAIGAGYFAVKERFETHKRITRVLLPVWLYVSVTGVVVYFFLRGIAPAIP